MGVMTSIIGSTVLFGGIGAYGYKKYKDTRQREKETKRERKEELAAQEKATAEVLAAPGKAAERARQDSLARRRGRARTILTSESGVPSPGVLKKKTLLGE